MRRPRQKNRTHCIDCGELLTIANKCYQGIYVRSYCIDCNRKRINAWHDNNKDRVREVTLRNTYGISIEDYETLMKLQNGVCAICGNADSKALSVDHNHETNQIRGLLCRNCNSFLGMIKEDLNLLEKTREYLLKYKDLPEMK